MDRRVFLKAAALASTGGLLDRNQASAQGAAPMRAAIRTAAPDSIKTRLAARELRTGLLLLNPAMEVTAEDAGANVTLLRLALDAAAFKGAEDYEIAASGNGAVLRAANDQALLYAVFEFLERQGLVFGIDGTSAPIDHIGRLRLPENGRPWKASPRFAVRGLLPWPDFLNCISVYNDEDFSAYFAAMLRMRFNMFGMHVYTQNTPGPLAESYLSFDFAGAGHRAALEDSTMTSWGYLPQRTSSFQNGRGAILRQGNIRRGRHAAGGGQLGDRRPHHRHDAARLQFRGRTRHPHRHWLRALSESGGDREGACRPKRCRIPTALSNRTPRAIFWSAGLPICSNVIPWWIMSGCGRTKTPIGKAATRTCRCRRRRSLRRMHFLQRHAPGKRLVIAGWGGVTQHFESLHQRVPEDIVFSALSDTLGWDPTNEAFGKLGSRERWPIPWLEDDPSMWFPQFRASRFQTDMKRAKDFGCQGMLGIHWRHRMVDPTATYFRAPPGMAA